MKKSKIIISKKKNCPGLDGLRYFCTWIAMCTTKYPTGFLYLIPRVDFIKRFLKLLTICFFNKVYALFLFVILKCHMVADTNPQYVAIVLSDHSWKQHNYPNGDLTFHWVLMVCFLSTFLIKKNCMKCYCQSWLHISCMGREKKFRPESGYTPTVSSAPRVMMSCFSQWGSGNKFDVKQNKDLKCKNCVAILLFWAMVLKQSWPIFDILLVLWEYSHTILIGADVPDKAWICILVFLSLKFCKA